MQSPRALSRTPDGRPLQKSFRANSERAGLHPDVPRGTASHAAVFLRPNQNATAVTTPDGAIRGARLTPVDTPGKANRLPKTRPGAAGH